MNTSHCDLKNQLKFLGFEHVDRMFQMIGSGSLRNVDMSHLLYLLRPIMMRHSQEQKYRGTSTTLMSLPPKVRHSNQHKVTSSYHHCNIISDTIAFF